MRSATFLSLAIAATSVVAQTPSGFSPSSNTNLGVSFNSTAVVPGVLLPVTGKIPDLLMPDHISNSSF